MWPDTDLEATRGTGLSAAPHDTDAIRQHYPDQEVVDYYLAKANAMRARSFRRFFSRGWQAVRRFLRRQLSPCRRVKLPPSTA